MKKLLKYDLLLQWRQGFWLVYFVVTFVYLAIIFNVPEENRYFLSMLFILSDTTVLGIIFVGALVLLEKQQQVQHALWITPMKPGAYVLSKALTLTLLSLTMSLLLLVLPNGFRYDFFLVLTAVVFSALLFTLFGIGLAARVKTLNGYIAAIMGASLLAIIPAIPFLLLEQPLWMLVFPINSAMDLIWFENPSWGRMVICLVILAFWTVQAYRFALHQYNHHMIN
jgi:fluoroquinolone transport system permease protein